MIILIDLFLNRKSMDSVGDMKFYWSTLKRRWDTRGHLYMFQQSPTPLQYHPTCGAGMFLRSSTFMCTNIAIYIVENVET